MMIDLPPPPPAIEEVILHLADNGDAVKVLGFAAHGDPADLARLVAAAAAAHLNGGRVEQAEPESMVIFLPDASRKAALDLYHRAVAGRFGKLRVEIMLVTVADAADGVDFDKEVRMYDPAAVRDD